MAPVRCSACDASLDGSPKFCPECGVRLGVAGRRSAHEVLRQFVHEQVADRLVATDGEIRDERRLVTAVFADLSGFSSMASRLDPEELLEVVRPVIGGLADLVWQHGGYVDKFAGDAVLAFFGAPVSREDDADRALHLALAMHRELPAMCTDRSPPLGLHIGVNSGHVIAHVGGSQVRLDYSLLGEAVVLAQRLESLAPEGETYVGESTRRLVADRFDMAPLGTLPAKGYAEPVPAFRLIGPAAPRHRRHGALLARPLVGRDRELRTLVDAVAPPRPDGHGLVVLTGEVGAGKSRLVEEARATAERAGVRWLQTTCSSYGQAVPYRPVADLLRRHLEEALPDAPEHERLGRRYGSTLPPEHLAGLSDLLSQEPDRSETALDPEARRRALHAAVGAWLQELTAAGPVVLAVEDVHAADPSTLALVDDLLASSPGLPIALVLTGRPQAEERLRAVLSHAPALRRSLRLEPLALDDIGRLLRDRLDGPVPPALDRLVQERSGGNPFFAHEIVTSLQTDGSLVHDGARWTMAEQSRDADVPPSVEALLAARIDLLPQQALVVLDAAAVIGRRGALPLLAAVVGDEPVSHALPHLAEAGLLVQAGDADAVLFRHPLVQEVAYARLLRRHRRALHLRVAEAVRALHDDGPAADDLLARHLFLGEAGRSAVEVLLRVGLRAKGLFANDEAVLQLERAAQVARLHAPDLLADVLCELADLHGLLGHYDTADGLYEEVLAHSGDVRGWVGRACALRLRGRYAEAVQVLDQAVTAGPTGDLRLLDLERSWVLSVSGRLGESVVAAQRGLGDDPPADRVTALLRLQIARAASVQGRPDDAVTHLERALAALPESDLRTASSALRLLGQAHESAGRLDQAVAALHRGLELAERTGNVEEVGGCLINLGLVELARDDLAAAERANLRAIEQFERIGLEAGRATGYTNLAEVLVAAGDLDRALRYAERALELAERIGHEIIAADATLRIATVLAGRGRHLEAARAAEAAAVRASAAGVAVLARDASQLAAREAQTARTGPGP